ncbi:uncharacterized protein BXZ73DRAFT_40003 [Epithele typhae]|uniref:uncharacterized protein n=1 Tax=Epithele typhae TaxID=378194 RepID=UPI002008B20D|nr:uncharacterized protein BXZ73DRAFT_40003 [Epithele typhae]KAH9944522.1 hypothetical protein BXZ73DRAFT_40003 [Epithele typhae]
MPLVVSPVPEIAISLASPEEPAPEPFSPFSQASFLSDDADSFRPTLLSPPASMSPKQLSPLRPKDAPVTGKGLERERFEALLQASRERNAAIGSKRPTTDLRKEIALKVHRSKQVERRALFLSKVQAPPSPSATLIPVTPPESPAVFHYSLPSPGLESPLGVFEAISLGVHAAPSCQPWVEQVDFRLPGDEPSKLFKFAPALRSQLSTKRKVLPSLDQITARLSSSGHVAPASPAPEARQLGSKRLPSFLRKPSRPESTPVSTPIIVIESAEPSPKAARPALPAGVGRLRFPPREVLPPTVPEPSKMKIAAPIPSLPSSPRSPIAPRLQITTTVVPRSKSSSPIELSESNLQAFIASRQSTSRNMLTRIRKRTLPPQVVVPRPSAMETEAEEAERKSRRHSAPPELPRRSRSGFEHPVLGLPGAF